MWPFDWFFGVNEKKLSKMSDKQLIKTSQRNRQGKVKSRTQMKADRAFRKQMRGKR